MANKEKNNLARGLVGADTKGASKTNVKKTKPDKTADAKAKPKKNGWHEFSKRAGKWFHELKSEYKKVVWPTREQVTTNTAIVLAVIVVLGAVIAGFDYAFEHWILNGVLKLATGY